MIQIEKPKLIENGAHYFFNEVLKQCHVVKMTYYNQMYNLGLLLLFIFILCTFLIYRYKGKLSDQEIEEKEKDKQIYILSKIKNYQSSRQRIKNEMITGLPEWENEQEYIIRNKANN